MTGRFSEEKGNLESTAMMMHAMRRQYRLLCAMFCLLVVMPLCALSIGFAADPAPSPSSPLESSGQPPEGGDIRERGLRNSGQGPAPGEAKIPPAPMPPGGLPPNLCHEVTQVHRQCKCFNQVECQALTGICQGACPAGSQRCECTPTFRGTSPPLPPNLCGYQSPFTITQCSCHNAADCQLLATVCPGSCPAGSHSCQCAPLQRR